MKKNIYVFLTFAVHGIGGTQIYIRNKLLYLQKNGWIVKIITSESGDNIMVKELVPYAKDIVPSIMKNPGLCSKSERDIALHCMSTIIGYSEENIIIETNFMAATPWGEMLAKRLNARHFILLIQENYYLNAPKYQKFFAWKYDRRELAANTPSAVTQLLNGYRKIDEGQSPFLQPYCHNVVEECETPELDALIENANFHIGSIGRLNKPFVIPMVKQVDDFTRKHLDKTFQLVLFGGSPDNMESEKILSFQHENFHIAITGPLFPVPLHLLQKMDLFIASAGAARTSYEAGGITIAMDANDYEPIGIMGRDTQLTISREGNKKHASINELLTEVLFTSKEFPKPPVVIEDIEEEFIKHIDFLKNMDKTQLYYDVSKLWPSFISRILHWLRH